MAAAQQAARVTDPVTHGLGLLGIVGGVLVGAVAGALLIASLPVTAPALVVGITVAAAAGAVAGGGLAGHQLLEGIQRACAIPSPPTGVIGLVGSLNVRIGMLPAARVISDQATACHGLYGTYHFPIPPLPPAPIAEGTQTIRINNLLATRVSSKTVCGASIQKGALTVYFGGPTERVLAVFDLESMLLTALGFIAKASLIAVAVLTIPLGAGAMAIFAAGFAGFVAISSGLGLLGDRIGPGWKDILQGGFGLGGIVVGAKLGSAFAEDEAEASVQKARWRQDRMLNDNRGFNVSPLGWDQYPTIGRNGTFVTDRAGVTDVVGEFQTGSDHVSISAEKAATLERNLGLGPGSLQNGFKIRQVDGLQGLAPRSPLIGNGQFLGPGQHLPAGAPEMVVDSIPTSDCPGVKTILCVTVHQ